MENPEEVSGSKLAHSSAKRARSPTQLQSGSYEAELFSCAPPAPTPNFAVGSAGGKRLRVVGDKGCRSSSKAVSSHSLPAYNKKGGLSSTIQQTSGDDHPTTWSKKGVQAKPATMGKIHHMHLVTFDMKQESIQVKHPAVFNSVFAGSPAKVVQVGTSVSNRGQSQRILVSSSQLAAPEGPGGAGLRNHQNPPRQSKSPRATGHGVRAMERVFVPNDCVSRLECSPMGLVKRFQTALSSFVGQQQPKMALFKHFLADTLFPPEVLVGIRSLPHAILLCGPPGTGKTSMLHAAARVCGYDICTPSTADILSKYTGQTEGNLQRVFDEARHKSQEPSNCGCVLFFDELDALTPRRGVADDQHGVRLVCQMLVELDAVQSRRVGLSQQMHGRQAYESQAHEASVSECEHPEPTGNTNFSTFTQSAPASTSELVGNSCGQSKNRLIVVAATNRPEVLDSAVLRRFEQIAFALPDEKARSAIVDHLLQTSGVDYAVSKEDLVAIGSLTSGFSPADLVTLIRQTCWKPLSNYMEHLWANVDDPGSQECAAVGKDSSHCLEARTITFQNIQENIRINGSSGAPDRQ